MKHSWAHRTRDTQRSRVYDADKAMYHLPDARKPTTVYAGTDEETAVAALLGLEENEENT